LPIFVAVLWDPKKLFQPETIFVAVFLSDEGFAVFHDRDQ
jgi:hypothetical protein